MNQKLDNKIIDKLFSSKNPDVISAIDSINKTGNSQYIPALIETLNTTNIEEIKAMILKTLSEIKHKDAVPFLVDAIEKEKYRALREDLVRSCWENGLDYTMDLSVFINILIEGEYMEAFEAFTLIENLEGKLTETSALEHIEKLKEGLNGANEDRQILIHRIIQFLPSLIQQKTL